MSALVSVFNVFSLTSGAILYRKRVLWLIFLITFVAIFSLDRLASRSRTLVLNLFSAGVHFSYPKNPRAPNNSEKRTETVPPFHQFIFGNIQFVLH